MRLSDAFLARHELVLCDCGNRIMHPPNRWQVRCGRCKAQGHLGALRSEWRARQPNAAEDEAKRDAITQRTAWYAEQREA